MGRAQGKNAPANFYIVHALLSTVAIGLARVPFSIPSPDVACLSQPGAGLILLDSPDSRAGKIRRLVSNSNSRSETLEQTPVSNPEAHGDAIAQQGLDRRSLAQLTPAWVHKGRAMGQADICAYAAAGRRFVVKDFRRRPWLVRRWWGRWILRREWERLEQLQGIAGIPRLLGWVDRDAFAMEWVEAERLPHLKDGSLLPVFFDRLAQLVGEVHARGVSHGDLRRKNVLVDHQQRPYLIDFATAFRARSSRRSQRLFEHLCQVDRLTVLKLKKHYCPESVTDEERRQLDEQPMALRVGRFLRKKVYRPLKPRHWRRRRARLREFLSGRKGDE